MSQRNSGFERKERDLYETPEWATLALVPHISDRIRPGMNVYEPAAGGGKMVAALAKAGFLVDADDIADGQDFLQCSRADHSAIISNPPYELATEFIERALGLQESVGGMVAMLLRRSRQDTIKAIRRLSQLRQEGSSYEAHQMVRGLQGLALVQPRMVHLGSPAQGAADAGLWPIAGGRMTLHPTRPSIASGQRQPRSCVRAPTLHAAAHTRLRAKGKEGGQGLWRLVVERPQPHPRPAPTGSTGTWRLQCPPHAPSDAGRCPAATRAPTATARPARGVMAQIFKGPYAASLHRAWSAREHPRNIELFQLTGWYFEGNPMPLKRRTTPRTTKTKPAKIPAGMTQSELATLLNVVQQRVSQLVQQGTFTALPNGKLDPWQAVPAYIAAIKADDGMGRIRAAKAIEIETRNAKERSELISIEDVEYSIAGIINRFSLDLAGVAAASTRDLPLREIIQTNLSAAIDQCKARLGAMADDFKAGKPTGDDADGGGDED